MATQRFLETLGTPRPYIPNTDRLVERVRHQVASVKRDGKRTYSIAVAFDSLFHPPLSNVPDVDVIVDAPSVHPVPVEAEGHTSQWVLVLERAQLSFAPWIPNLQTAIVSRTSQQLQGLGRG